MAIEASRTIAGDRAVELLELHDLTIQEAATFEGGESSLGVKTLRSLSSIDYHREHTVTARFSCYSTPVLSTGSGQDMDLTANGYIRLFPANLMGQRSLVLQSRNHNMSRASMQMDSTPASPSSDTAIPDHSGLCPPYSGGSMMPKP